MPQRRDVQPTKRRSYLGHLEGFGRDAEPSFHVHERAVVPATGQDGDRYGNADDSVEPRALILGRFAPFAGDEVHGSAGTTAIERFEKPAKSSSLGPVVP